MTGCIGCTKTRDCEQTGETRMKVDWVLSHVQYDQYASDMLHGSVKLCYCKFCHNNDFCRPLH
jgi:hypothetical protein